ncbi:hypothetical protein L2E82_21045 [Cichorium intybus]|uniref:Uncharacterized protein n=1 Tax=Cichorium intybus TaxID=13427 RepID=A0ACB9DVC1_CICIN|nr:hypothetical protein L2E82_21045 [Cichorium intybus]
MKSCVAKNTIHDHLYRGTFLSVDDDSHLITSRDNTFTCGFYGFQTNAYWFAIWFSNSKDRTVVWTANSNKPLNGHGSKLTLHTNGAMVLTDVDGTIVSSDRLRFNASDMAFGIRRRLTMDYDGNLRIYSLNGSTGLWSISWQAVAQPCNIHGICGRNGICVYGEKPECSCPPLYEWSDPTDFSQGCKPTFNRTCGNSTRFRFLPIRYADYFGFDLNFSSTISLESCRDICLADCRCQAFGYKLTGKGDCYVKSALFNGYRYPKFPGTIYFKLPIGMQTPESASILTGSKTTCRHVPIMLGSPSMYESHGGKVKWVYLYSFVSAIGLVEALIILLGLTLRWRMEIGRGGSGVVYKGVLEDERVVAVKRLGDVSDGGEFWTELSTIGRINHMNLVRMWGFCSQKQHKLLVYEYVENQSLDKRLFSSSFLQWKERFEVAIGIAKGLAYLHHECLEWVIHCDVKPENILLDGAFQAKIADFGLAKLSQRGGPNSEFTRVRGTKGYMAPEWARNLPITAKVDVYSYGVVILEMTQGIRLSNISVHGGEEKESELKRFARETKMKIPEEKGLWIEEIIDPRLGGLFSRKQAATLVEVGLCCVEEDRHKRPTMDSVVQLLIDCEHE